MGTYQLQTEIEIKAAPERIWSILTDREAYPDWNPFIRSIRGDLVRGAKLEVRIQPPGAKGMTFRPSVLVAESNRELRWLGHFLFPGLFDGEHSFVIEPVASGPVIFRQCERFSGILVSLFRGSLDGATRRGFEEMNRALKARAEAGIAF
ncbi:SRPBCC domain-containing protein [Geomesophilobacter sediminis]|uniref:SRPBCC domain-containing protein n=1 Tax=Geomesophilobacter sediminis TaxID=2798584 RepID=A0A8J7M102_9BACT|nr:SRPBCC domain-containing protein [Geomesophilobacter sediminis]MBJ6726549.1 SRPBCC domain-containing protein [Geomesophilobacter sediminis]